MTKISSPTRQAIAELKRKGLKSNSTPPYGYQFRAGRQIKHPEEQKALRAIGRWRRKGLSITKCVEKLEAEGHKPRGAAWHRTTVSRLVHRLKANA
jgi:hypothetical protein